MRKFADTQLVDVAKAPCLTCAERAVKAHHLILGRAARQCCWGLGRDARGCAARPAAGRHGRITRSARQGHHRQRPGLRRAVAPVAQRARPVQALTRQAPVRARLRQRARVVYPMPVPHWQAHWLPHAAGVVLALLARSHLPSPWRIPDRSPAARDRSCWSRNSGRRSRARTVRRLRYSFPKGAKSSGGRC